MIVCCAIRMSLLFVLRPDFGVTEFWKKEEERTIGGQKKAAFVPGREEEGRTGRDSLADETLGRTDRGRRRERK